MAWDIDTEALEGEIAALGGLAFPELQERFASLTGSPPPKRIGRKLLILAIAYEMQRKAFSIRTDRLMSAVRKVKAEHGAKADSGTTPVEARPSRPRKTLSAGGRLVREWRGKTYEVYVAEDGCYLDGKRYKSLSSAAFAITGAKWNGPAFFGLRTKRTDGS